MPNLTDKNEIEKALTDAQITVCQGLHGTIKLMFQDEKYKKIHTVCVLLPLLLFYILPAELGQSWPKRRSFKKHIPVLMHRELAKFFGENEAYMLKQIKEARDEQEDS